MAARILVTEDSPTQAERLRLLLEGAGHAVEVAENGRLALVSARREPPQLVLSDVVMPEMDGYALCAALKSDPTTRAIPVVLLTERSDASAIVTGLERGADYFVAKSLGDEALLERLRLILERGAGSPRLPAEPEAAPTAGTVLVVEDDDELRDFLEEYLVLAGFRPLTASSATEALDLCERSAPDVVLTDVNMPGMSGIELTARLKADPRFRLVPVVILTAVSDRESRVVGLSAGADDFFSKPVDLAELEARVRSLVRLGRLQSELEARTRLLRTLFGRFVSEAVASEIIERPARLPAAGAKREVSVMFADLRGFTALADALDPQDVVEILSAYLAEAVEAVFEQGGTVDKFRGDGVMAVFGAPVVQPDSAERAVRCALDLQARVARLQFPRFPDLQLRLGVGINTGTAVVGPIGSPRRMDYTAIGSEVNLAQRLEASAGPGQILISDSTYRQLGPLAHVREIGLLRLSGVTRPVPTFDVLGFTAQ